MGQRMEREGGVRGQRMEREGAGKEGTENE